MKQGFVTKISNEGDSENPNNYRPISITSVPAKVFEKVLREQTRRPERFEPENIRGGTLERFRKFRVSKIFSQRKGISLLFAETFFV